MNLFIYRSLLAKLIWFVLAALLALVGFCAAPPARGADASVTALPGDSVYHLQARLVDQNGRSISLDQQRGQVVLVSMFYTSCQFVCPMLIEAIRDTQRKLGDAERAQLQVLMVTIDPAHDSVAVLKQTAQQRQIDDTHWTLARTDASSTRKIAALLGVQYRALGNGEFNHTTSLVLLDGQGRVVGRSSQLGNAHPAFVNLVKTTLQTTAH
jgi:protein SCO1